LLTLKGVVPTSDSNLHDSMLVV